MIHRDCEGWHRRDFLRFGASGLLGLSLPDLLRAEATAPKKRADSVIMLWLSGGPSTIDMWDLKPDAPETIRGKFKPIATTVPGIQIGEHLPRMAKTMKSITLLRSLQHTLPVHGPGSVYMTTGNSPLGALTFPSLGSLAGHLLPVQPDLPAYVVGTGKGAAAYAGYLGAANNPFVVDGLTPGKDGRVALASKVQMRGAVLPKGFSLDELDNREKLLQGFDRGLAALEQAPGLGDGLDAFHKKALHILHSDRTRTALELDREPEAKRERFGLTAFGQGALMARRLIEAGVRFVTVALGGWDTHVKNFDQLERLLPHLDQTLSALVEDLEERGMLDRTVVYCVGEFGRTPVVNKEAGRDHWARSMTAVLAGGGFKHGCVYGATDKEGMAAVTAPCTPDDVSATLFSCLGVNPHRELTTDAGRPVQLFREGKVIQGVLA